MTKAILGRKLGMTQVWSEDDRLVPVTVVEAGPCVISQIRTVERDGYTALQFAYGDIKTGKANKPTAGHFAKAGSEPKKHVREVRVDDTDEYKIGDEVKADVFEVGDAISVTGTSKGKGFAGVIKRHNFQGGRATHGSHHHRTPGSIGQASTPSRVFKGKKMPGRMGGDTITVRNLEIVRIDVEQNLLIIKGAVPGGKGSILTIRAR